MNEREIFISALQKENVAERQAFLDEACGANAVLRQRVEGLLRTYERAGSFLEHPVENPDTRAGIDPQILTGDGSRSSAERVGDMIGPYKLLQQIGEGGMGTVFMAEQTEPIRRKVALKMIKPGMDSPGANQIIARFEAERQALSVMDHVNIARVFDAGATDSGLPFFVMELVHGVPITTYCDDNRLTPRQRLELFVPVCQAIQHAHQKGIIHRDIKPSNVMVTLYDGKPVPKVIDFGVAKAIEQNLTERTLFTQYGTMVGTFGYMSPEQAEMSALGADTRSDIYSLGVLLYELLTGSTPLSPKRLKEAALVEVLRMIKEEDPPKPSTRLSDSGEALASISAQRQMEPAKLTSLVRGELDWIVMKALEKDRNHRYETANGFAADVQRYLNDEPVQACPPSAGYRFRKFARRNKAALLTASVVVAALMGGTAVATWQAVVATRAKQDALAAETETRIERDKAVAEKERANEEAAISNAINDFLQKDLLAEAAPEKNARNQQVTVEELLGRAAARIAGKFEQRPTIEAAIRMTIGETYSALGNYAAAQPHAERALELRRRVLGEEHPRTLASLNLLARLYSSQGKFAMAEALYLAALEIGRRVLGPEHYETLVDMNNLATVYRAQGEHSKAEPIFVETLEARRRSLGKEHQHTLASLNNLAALYWEQGRFARAEPLFVEVLEINTRVLGEEHPVTLLCTMNLAGLYQEQGQFAKAEALKVKNLDVGRRVLGEEHPYTVNFRNTLALLYQARGQYTKAEQLFVEAVQISRRVLGEEHPDTLSSMNYLASLHQVQGRFADAGTSFTKTLEVRRRVLGNEHPDTLNSLNNLAALYQVQNQLSDAEPLLRESLNIRERKLPDDWKTFHTKALLGGSLLGQEKYAEAEPLLLAGYEGMKQREAKIPWDRKSRLVETVESLVRLYEAWGKPGQAEQWRAKLPPKEPANGKSKSESEVDK